MITGLKIQFRALIFCCLFIACLAYSAYAHRVNLYAYAEGGMVYSECYFSDGSKCRNSLIEVFDNKNGTKLFEGKTDEEGRFSFKIPKATSLKLAVNAGMGHRAQYTVSIDEIKEALGTTGNIAEDTVMDTRSVKAKKSWESIQSPDLQSSDIEVVIERAVEKRLEPVMRMLIELNRKLDRPTLTEVIGGIGYIIGIIGIFAYFKSKRHIKG